MAASMYGFMRSLGMPVGVAVAGTAFQNAMAARLSQHGLPESIAHDSERYVYVLHEMSPHNKYRAGIVDAYMHGFRYVWILMTAMSASGLVVGLCIRRFSMDKSLCSTFSARGRSELLVGGPKRAGVGRVEEGATGNVEAGDSADVEAVAGPSVSVSADTSLDVEKQAQTQTQG